MLYELQDSSNVTLAVKDAQSNRHVCKFHKFGHCKFGQGSVSLKQTAPMLILSL